jgi:hypothetical protein
MLKANDAILAEESHMPLYKELVEKYLVDYTWRCNPKYT